MMDRKLWQYPAKTQPVQEVALPTLGWLVQQPDPIRRPSELVHEQLVFTRLVELAEIPIGWLVQHPEPVLPLPVPPSESVLVEFGVPIPPTVPDIDFIVQYPDPLPKPPPIQTEPELAFEHENLIPAPDWLVQHPEPVRPLERLVPEAFAFEFEHELLIPSIDWLQQLPDPIQELRRPPTEPIAPELAEVPPPLAVFDWSMQHPDPLGLRPWLAPDAGVQPPFIEEITLDKWWQQQFNPTLAPPPRLWEPIDLPWDETLWPITLDKWWIQYHNPALPLPRVQGFIILLEFAVPPSVLVPVVFHFEACQALWEIVHPEDWESAVAPSGYIWLGDYIPPPSGYIAVEGGNAPWDMVR